MLFENGELLIKKIVILATIFLMHSTFASSTSLEAGESAMARGHYGTAMRALLPLANDGNIDAQAYIGHLYEKGLGVIQDYDAAIEWYEKAGSKGSFQAQHSLGMLYFTGEGTSLNHPAAYEWFIKASDHNFPPSLYMLGLMYHQGHSVAINFERARFWFLKAAKLGSANAQFMYAFMLQSAEGGPSESDKAMVWAILSEKNGKEDAVAITVPAGMNMTQLEIEAAGKIASECLTSSYAECPE